MKQGEVKLNPVTVLTSKEWRNAGFSPEDAKVWKELGFWSFSAAEFRKAGFSPGQAKDWADAGFSSFSAVEWRDAGYSLDLYSRAIYFRHQQSTETLKTLAI